MAPGPLPVSALCLGRGLRQHDEPGFYLFVSHKSVHVGYYLGVCLIFSKFSHREHINQAMNQNQVYCHCNASTTKLEEL